MIKEGMICLWGFLEYRAQVAPPAKHKSFMKGCAGNPQPGNRFVSFVRVTGGWTQNPRGPACKSRGPSAVGLAPGAPGLAPQPWPGISF